MKTAAIILLALVAFTVLFTACGDTAPDIDEGMPADGQDADAADLADEVITDEVLTDDNSEDFIELGDMI